MNFLIIGLGKVGMTYDFSAPNFQILTHLKAINNVIPKGENVVYGFDISKSTREILNKNYPAINWAVSLMDLSNVLFENVIIATPIEEIHKTVQDVLNKISFVNLVIEKPGAANSSEYKQLIELVRNQGKRIMIAFPRRSLPSSLFIKSSLESCRSTSYWEISIQYSGSPKNILSHFIDLIDYWFPDKKFILNFKGNSFVGEQKSERLSENTINIKQTSDKYDEKFAVDLGQLSKYQIVQNLSKATLSLSASKSDGISVSILESMAVGTPVLATNIEANLEFINEGINGYLFESNSPTALANKLKEILNSKNSLTHISKAGREWVEKFSDFEKNMFQLTEKIDTLISPYENKIS